MLQLGGEVHGAMVRASAAFVDRGSTYRGFYYWGFMGGFALPVRRSAAYFGLGLGGLAYGENAFAEPQYKLVAVGPALTPEVGFILGHRRAFGRTIVSAQLHIPLSTHIERESSAPQG